MSIKDQEKAEVAELLLERAEMGRLGVSLPPDKLMLLKRLLFRLGITNVKLARRSNVKRYAEPTEPTQPVQSGPLAKWKGQGPTQPPKKISAALKALHEKAALIPVTDEPLPVVKRPQSASYRPRVPARDTEGRNIPGGFSVGTRSGRRAFMNYLDETGEDSDFRHRVDEEARYQADQYEPDLDDERLRQIAAENEWTPVDALDSIKEYHPEAADAIDQWHRLQTYRPRTDQPNLFDPGRYPHTDTHSLADQFADPDSGVETSLANYLRTYHPELDHPAIDRTLNMHAGMRRNEMESAINYAEDHERQWYADNMDTSDIEDEILQQMHDEMEQEGRWEDREPEADNEDDSDEQETSLLHQPSPQSLTAAPEEPKQLPEGPKDNRWYGDSHVHTYKFKTPSGRPFSIDIGHYNLDGSKVDNLTFNDDRGSYAQTDKGEAHAIFEHVASAIGAYMLAKKPDVLTFSAAETDKEREGKQRPGDSRQKMYASLIKHLTRLSPNYAAGAVKMPGGGKNFFVFDRSKVDNVEQLVRNRFGGDEGHEVEPVVLSRIGTKRRFAKIDGHAVAHPLVQGFPIETALRHLANDPNNHPSIRELAKVAVTGGKNGDGSNIPVALWALHDALHEHKHPLKDAYNWQSAADKIGLDAHTHKALREEAERSRYHAGTDANDPNRDPFTFTPEHHAIQAAMAIGRSGTGRTPEGWTSQYREAMRDRVMNRVHELAPTSQDKDIEESLQRHHWRAMKHWRQSTINDNNDTEGEQRIEEHDKGPFKRIAGRPEYLNAAEKATRYRRLFRGLAKRMARLPTNRNLTEAQSAMDPKKIQFIANHHHTMAYAHTKLSNIFFDQGRKQHAILAGKLADDHRRQRDQYLRTYLPASQWDAVYDNHAEPTNSDMQRARREFVSAAQKVVPSKLQRKATRYSRLLHKLRYALGEGRSSRHIGGEELFSHDYDGGVANVIPRNEGQTLHVDYVGPKDAQPGQIDRLNTLGTGKVRRLVTSLKAKYPNAKFLTGIRPSGRRVLRKLAKRRYQMVAGDFLDALRRIRSSDQEAVKKSMEEIAAKLGAKPASTVNALHDSPNYSVPGVAMAIYSNLAPEKVQALAAWGALTGNIPGNAVFHIRPDGPDLLHRFRMQGSGHDLRARMNKAGLVSRILIPHRTGFDVMIPDKGGSLRDRVKGFVQQQKVELQTSRGHFKTIGSSDQARAREMFRNAIVKQESKP